MELTQINKDYFQSFQTLSNNPNESEHIKEQLETIFNEKKYQQMSIHEKYNELKKRIDNEEIREYGIVLPNGFPSTYSFVIFTEERERKLKMLCRQMKRRMNEKGIVLTKFQMEHIGKVNGYSKNEIENWLNWEMKVVELKDFENSSNVINILSNDDEKLNETQRNKIQIQVWEFGYQFYHQKEIEIIEDEMKFISIENIQPFQMICLSSSRQCKEINNDGNILEKEQIENWLKESINDIIEQFVNDNNVEDTFIQLIINRKYQIELNEILFQIEKEYNEKENYSFAIVYKDESKDLINELIIDTSLSTSSHNDLEDNKQQIIKQIKQKIELQHESLSSLIFQLNNSQQSQQMEEDDEEENENWYEQLLQKDANEIYEEFVEQLSNDQKSILQKILEKSPRRINRFRQKSIPEEITLPEGNYSYDKHEIWNFIKSNEFMELENGFIQYIVFKKRYPFFSPQMIAEIFERKLQTYKPIYQSSIFLKKSVFNTVIKHLKELIEMEYVLTEQIYYSHFIKQYGLEMINLMDEIEYIGFKWLKCQRDFRISKKSVELDQIEMNELDTILFDQPNDIVYCISGFHSLLQQSLPFMSMSFESYQPNNYDLTKKHETFFISINSLNQKKFFFFSPNEMKLKKNLNPHDDKNEINIVQSENELFIKDHCSFLIKNILNDIQNVLNKKDSSDEIIIIDDCDENSMKMEKEKKRCIIIVEEWWKELIQSFISIEWLTSVFNENNHPLIEIQQITIDKYLISSSTYELELHFIYFSEIINQFCNPTSVMIHSAINKSIEHNPTQKELQRIVSDEEYKYTILSQYLTNETITQTFKECGLLDSTSSQFHNNFNKHTSEWNILYSLIFKGKTTIINIQNIETLYRMIILKELQSLPSTEISLEFEQWIQALIKKYPILEFSDVYSLEDKPNELKRISTVVLSPEERKSINNLFHNNEENEEEFDSIDYHSQTTSLQSLQSLTKSSTLFLEDDVVNYQHKKFKRIILGASQSIHVSRLFSNIITNENNKQNNTNKINEEE